ncbi:MULTISPECIES: hypothetical protein [unclassified Brachybacterium]|uniref:hypothetical protein n=1 Tax=unclassified Brachybacterium TaxID=2623841 RepID=UPI0036083F52
MTPSPASRSLFIALTEGTYWFLVIGVLLALGSSPTLLAWMLLGDAPSTAFVQTIAAVPLAPAVTAALHAWRARAQDPEPVPAARFLHGYRATVVDSLKVAVPAAVVLGVLATNLSHGYAVGTQGLNLAFVVIGALVLVVSVRALTIASGFSFRLPDLVRLSFHTSVTMPRPTVSLVCLGIVTLGIVHVAGVLTVLLAAPLLTFALWWSQQPVAHVIRERFVSPEAESASTPAV